MRRNLLLGALCLAGLISCKPKKEGVDPESVRICKALAEIMVRHSACDIGEPDLSGASREEQAEVIKEISSMCEYDDSWKEEVECASPNLPVLEKFAKTLRAAGDCEAVQKIEGPPTWLPADWCLD